MPETCRDLLRDMLATASNISDFDDLLDFHGFSADRIRAAIAADDAELARLRRIKEAARRVRVAEAALSRATEHPDWDGLVEAVGGSQSALAAMYAIVAEIDQAEADHA